MIKSSWAILLCKFNDDSTEPFSRDYYEDLFTASGVGSLNMVDFFRDVSHGNLDLSDTRVFGWYTLNKSRSDYLADTKKPDITPEEFGVALNKGRNELIDWAHQAAAANGDSLSQYVSVVICMNVQTDLFGGGSGVVCDNNSTDPRFLGQEMGHFYGLDHSRAETFKPCGDQTVDYQDFWDVMSTAGCAFSAPHPRYGFIGPGLNASNMESRGWLDESRVWKTDNPSFDRVVTLRPLHRRDLPGYLAARLGEYLIEFRSKEKWDVEIPQPAVLIHRFEDNHSYLMSANSGEEDLVAGNVFGTTDTTSLASIVSEATGVEVVEINATEQFVKIRLVKHPAFEEPSLGPGILVGGLLGGIARGGAGILILPGGTIKRVPPRSPLLQVMEQIAVYESTQSIASVHTRNAVRQEALSTIRTLAENQIQTLQAFRQPAPPRQTQEYKVSMPVQKYTK